MWDKMGECDITERQITSSVTWHDNTYIGLPVCEHEHNIWPENTLSCKKRCVAL